MLFGLDFCSHERIVSSLERFLRLCSPLTWPAISVFFLDERLYDRLSSFLSVPDALFRDGTSLQTSVFPLSMKATFPETASAFPLSFLADHF